MGQFRKDRLAEEIRKEVAIIIRTMKDPRLGFVSIMKVQVDPDMTLAKIFVSHFGNQNELDESILVLQRGAGYIRKELAKALKTRTVPELVFVEDNSIEQGFKITKILADYNQENQHDDKPSPEEV